MKNFIRFVLILLLKALVYMTQGSSFCVSLSTTYVTWSEAVKTCKDNGGKLVSVETALGYNQEVQDIIGDTDVWTASYLQNSVNEKNVFCGFNYLSSTLTYNSEVFYGPCDANRNYLCTTSEFCYYEILAHYKCKQWSTILYDVVKQTSCYRCTASKQNLVVYNSTRANVKCNETVSYGQFTLNSQIKPGFYWSNWNIKAIEVNGIGQLSRMHRYCGAYKRSIGKYFANCFGKRLSLCSTNGTSSSLWKAKITTSATTCIEVNIKETMTAKGGTEQEATSGIGVKIGVPIGIVLVLTCGSLIILYIYRRRIKCWQSSNSKHENGRMNQFHTQETSPVHGQLNVYSESIQETPTSPEHHTNENNITDISAQYAVVKKPKKSDTKTSRKDDNSIESYQKATNDEYDVTGRFQNCRSNQSDNLYNHFESEDEYNSTSFVRKGECNNLYNTTGDHSLVESDYDSTAQVNNTALHDDVYNHLSQN